MLCKATTSQYLFYHENTFLLVTGKAQTQYLRLELSQLGVEIQKCT